MRRISCESCSVRGGSVACNLPADVLADFRSAGTAVLYRPRQVIFGEGTPAASLYLLCHGAVKIFHSDRFGRDHILEVAAPGALLGEMALDDGERMSVSAEALTEAQVLHVSREHLAGFIGRHPETALRFIAALSRELAVARQKVRELALKSAEGRLAGLLLQLARTDGSSVAAGARLHLSYTRRELAEMIGVSTETAIRLLAGLKRKGAIATDKREVVIADAERLMRIAQYDETTLPEDHPEAGARRDAG
jgi:CRP-like cAMP-binding protein